MSDLFDIFFKDFFQTKSPFLQLEGCERKDVSYPVNVIQNDDNIEFEISALGLKKEDIDIEVDGDMLKVKHQKEESSEYKKPNYIYKGITNKSFDLGWKISSKYDLSNIKAKMDNGLLRISAPLNKKMLPKKVDIAIEG